MGLLDTLFKQRVLGPRKRSPMDELLPTGESVDEAVGRIIRPRRVDASTIAPEERFNAVLSASEGQPVVPANNINMHTPYGMVVDGEPVTVNPAPQVGRVLGARRAVSPDVEIDPAVLDTSATRPRSARFPDDTDRLIHNRTPVEMGGGFIPQKSPWWKSALEMLSRTIAPAAQQALQNAARRGEMARGADFAQALIGGAAGAASGIIDRTLPDRLRAAEELGQLHAEKGRRLSERKAQAEIQDAATDREYKRALTAKALRVPAPKVTYKPNAQGQLLRIEESTDGEQPKVSVIDSAKKTIVPKVHEADGRLLVYNSETGRFDPALDKNGREITSELKTPVDFEIDGKTYRVTPSTAAIATATGKRFEISLAATESRFERSQQNQNERDAKRDENAARDDYDRSYKSAGSMLSSVNAIRARANAAKTPEAANALHEQADALEVQLKTQYGDFVEGDSMSQPTGDSAVGNAAIGAARAANPLRLKPRTAPAPSSSAAPKSKWQEYVDTYFGGDEVKARTYQNRKK